MAQAVWPGMLERGFGRIINFASQVAYKGMAGLTHYCAAKAGLVGFSRALAAELKPANIRVTAICPGSVEGERIERVIAAGGRLGGYGGQEPLKRALLVAEGVPVSGSRVRELARVRWRTAAASLRRI